MKKFSIAVHGGAGTLLPSETSREKDKAYEAALAHALKAGYSILEKGGAALDAVEAAVVSLEDCPLFNAGKGSVYTHEGAHELEASIMCGKTLQAGAVAGVRHIKNPVSLCRHVLADDRFVYLFGQGAESFAEQLGISLVDGHYFDSDFRLAQLKHAISEGKEGILDHDGSKKFGTVGAVAKDMAGNLAAATSTGGLTNKKYGRVGDSSVIGAGCFADNQSCAISATGYGEYFLRNVTAHEIAAIMKHGGKSLDDAAAQVVFGQLKPMGGEGGIIGVDANGHIVLSFNSEGMYRGWANDADGRFHTKIYR